MEKIDQSGPIKDWFNKTFKNLGKRTRHNDGGHVVGKSSKNHMSIEEAAKMYVDRPINKPLSKEMKSWKDEGLSVDDAKGISNFSNQTGNTPYYEKVYNAKQGIKPKPTNDKPLVDPIAEEDDNN